MGRQDIVKHCSGKLHLTMAKSMEKQVSIVSCMSAQSQQDTKTIEAEVKMAVITASSNIPLAFHDKLSPAIRSCFSDSKTAQAYHSASTKATCMINGAIAPSLLNDLVDQMKKQPFSISIDGSNDNDLEKMNPITVRVYNLQQHRVTTKFLDMGTSSSSTAEALFNTFDTRLSTILNTSNPWLNCTSCGVDNTSVNIGVRNSIKTRVLQKNKSIFFNGCPCHIIHNAGQKAGNVFASQTGFDVEELIIDLFYWFDNSTKKKNALKSFCSFCDQPYRAVIKHVSTRWLSLELAVDRMLKQYPSLKSYFLSNDEGKARFQRLKGIFENPMSEVYLLFFQAVLPSFTHTNLFLQREEPLIYCLKAQLVNLVKKILAKFVLPEFILPGIRKDDFVSIDYKTLENQVQDENLVIGFTTNQKLIRLLEEGDISNSDVKHFYRSVRVLLMIHYYTMPTGSISETGKGAIWFLLNISLACMIAFLEILIMKS